ncbi:MAG: hypothetical protein JOZ65_14130 [Chloroflexi bacterium]|nr:hypothetical protein [Chloroflexota bacterium]
MALAASIGCTPGHRTEQVAPSPNTLPHSSVQEALVRQYLDLVAAERYAQAWQPLTPEPPAARTPEAFAAECGARGAAWNSRA